MNTVMIKAFVKSMTNPPIIGTTRNARGAGPNRATRVSVFATAFRKAYNNKYSRENQRNKRKAGRDVRNQIPGSSGGVKSIRGVPGTWISGDWIVRGF
jgi:hypothetical protein